MKINTKNIKIKSICATLFISLFLSCNSGVIEELEKKNTFFDSLVKIGHNFQEIFGSFGNTIGDALGFSAVKSDDTRDKVGKHFEKLGEALTVTKNKLNDLSSKISEAKNVDGNTIEAVKGAIKVADDVFDKLINALTNLTGVSKGASGIAIGDNNNTSAAETDVNAVSENVRAIIEIANEIAKNSGGRYY